MEMSPYLSFNGECQSAFRFYEHCLGGQLGTIFRYAGTPLPDQVPADWQDKIMHASLTLGGHLLMGADITPDRYQAPRGAVRHARGSLWHTVADQLRRVRAASRSLTP